MIHKLPKQVLLIYNEIHVISQSFAIAQVYDMCQCSVAL